MAIKDIVVPWGIKRHNITDSLLVKYVKTNHLVDAIVDVIK